MADDPQLAKWALFSWIHMIHRIGLYDVSTEISNDGVSFIIDEFRVVLGVQPTPFCF